MLRVLKLLFGASKMEIRHAFKAMKEILKKRNNFNDAVFLCKHFGQTPDLVIRVRLVLRKFQQRKKRKRTTQNGTAPSQYLSNAPQLP